MNTAAASDSMNSNRASYSPEDDKLRLYVGRVPRDEYEKLRADGWTSTPKQSCDFVATWTPSRHATALEYAEVIDDEDQTPEDRAADRAERFAGYREKRLDEATGHADRYEAGPSAHGFQSEARAERSAARHDRIGTRATDAWSKAEYWQHRTAGVIRHALYKSTPAVRMGRIKEMEAELRKLEKSLAEYVAKYQAWQSVAACTETETQNRMGVNLAYHEHGDYTHPRTGRTSYLYSLTNKEDEREADPLTGAELAALWLSRHHEPRTETDWTQHLKLRLAYEHQMLEAAGGRAAFVEMEAGGFIGNRQIQKVNKSNATGRVVSVLVKDNQPSLVNHYGNPYPNGEARVLSHTIETERLPVDAYRPPTDEERAAFLAEKKARKAAAPKAAPCPLINPTDEDAERLQEAWNERAKDEHCASNKRRYGKDYAEQFKPSTVCRITQAAYSANSKGSYARAETRGLCADMILEPQSSNMWRATDKAEKEQRGPAVCQIRQTSGDGSDYGARRVIVLTDKPQKPLPGAVWKQYQAPAPEPTQQATEQADFALL